VIAAASHAPHDVRDCTFVRSLFGTLVIAAALHAPTPDNLVGNCFEQLSWGSRRGGASPRFEQTETGMSFEVSRTRTGDMP
jgi:hypothetical protein